MIEHIRKIIAPATVNLNCQPVQNHTCFCCCDPIPLLLCPLLSPCCAKIGGVGPLDRRRNRIGYHNIIESVCTPRIVDDEIHPLVAGWINVVEDPGDFHPD